MDICKEFETACKNCDKFSLLQLINSTDPFISKNKSLRFNDCIAYSSNLETIKFLKKRKFFYTDKMTYRKCIESFNLDIIEWGLLNGIVFGEDSFDIAVKLNYTVEMLEVLIENFKFKIGINAISYAVEREDLVLLEFLKRKMPFQVE